MSDDLMIAYQLGLHDMLEKLRERADEIEALRAENETLRLELDMQQATILVPSQKDDQRRIERLTSALKEALDEAAAHRAKNEKLREALKPFAYYATQIPDDVSNTASASGTVGDLRAAAAAIRESEAKP